MRSGIKLIAFITAIMLSISMAGCSGNETVQTRVYHGYKKILEKPDQIDFGGEIDPDKGKISYELVYFGSEEAPKLLVMAPTRQNVKTKLVKVYSFDATSNTIVDPGESLVVGRDEDGRQLGAISVKNDSSALVYRSSSPKEESASTELITFGDGKLQKDLEWSGKISETPKATEEQQLGFSQLTDDQKLVKYSKNELPTNTEIAAFNDGQLKEIRAKAHQAYSGVIKNPADYFSDNDTVKGPFKYSLVYLNGLDVPALLLSGQMDASSEDNKVFLFDEEADKAFEVKSPEQLSTGVGAGPRYFLEAFLNEDGLVHVYISGGTGESIFKRLFLSGSEFKEETIWEGRIDSKPEWKTFAPFFLDVSSADFLDAYIEGKLPTNEAIDDFAAQFKDEPRQEEQQKKSPNPTDSRVSNAKAAGKTVISGTVLQMNTVELVDLQLRQGVLSETEKQTFYMQDNVGSGNGQTYYVLKLDQPQDITCHNGGDPGDRTESGRTLLSLPDDAANYVGKHAHVIINQCYWQSDVSLPYLEPRGHEVEIIPG